MLVLSRRYLNSIHERAARMCINTVIDVGTVVGTVNNIIGINYDILIRNKVILWTTVVAALDKRCNY